MTHFWNFSKNEDTGEAELRIDGEIVDDELAWMYEWFGIQAASPNAFRNALAEYKGQDITVWIDSWGGDTTAAAGIYNALKEHNGKITIKIDGKAVSAASIIAMAGDVVKMSPVGIIMIHNPWSGATGEAKDMRLMADILDEVKETIINAYELKTKKSRDEISKLMDEETWMSPKKALAEGFIDEILYTETKEEESIENSFMFSRMAIQNSASKSMKRFIEQYKKINNNEEPVKEPPEQTEQNQQVINLLTEIKTILDEGKTLSSANEDRIRQARGLLDEVLEQLPDEEAENKTDQPTNQQQGLKLLSSYRAQVQINKNKLRRKINV